MTDLHDHGLFMPPSVGSPSAAPSSSTDDASMTPEQRAEAAAAALELTVARRLFWWGFALLPGLWLMVWLVAAGGRPPRS